MLGKAKRQKNLAWHRALGSTKGRNGTPHTKKREYFKRGLGRLLQTARARQRRSRAALFHFRFLYSLEIGAKNRWRDAFSAGGFLVAAGERKDVFWQGQEEERRGEGEESLSSFSPSFIFEPTQNLSHPPLFCVQRARRRRRRRRRRPNCGGSEYERGEHPRCLSRKGGKYIHKDLPFDCPRGGLRRYELPGLGQAYCWVFLCSLYPSCKICHIACTLKERRNSNERIEKGVTRAYGFPYLNAPSFPLSHDAWATLHCTKE